MRTIVKVLTWDGEFVADAFIQGVEHVEGVEGWFSSIVLLSLAGKKLYGWKHMIAPYTLMLEYKNGSG
jgi:hypothetical protein